MSRLRGKTIVFEVDGTEYSGGVSNVNMNSELGERSFGAYEESLEFRCQVVGFQDFAAASFHSYLWDNPGKTVTITYAPHGNATATSSQPHFEATGYAEVLPAIGGAAGEYFTYDIAFVLDAAPTRVES